MPRGCWAIGLFSSDISYLVTMPSKGPRAHLRGVILLFIPETNHVSIYFSVPDSVGIGCMDLEEAQVEKRILQQIRLSESSRV